MIHWELCKKFKFDHTIKCYMHNPESVMENVMHKVLWDSEVQTDHLILVRRLDLVKVNKKEKPCRIVVFAVPADHRLELKENEKRNKYLDLARKFEKYKRRNMKVMVTPIVIGALGTIPKGLEKKLEDIEIRRQVETIRTIALLWSARILRRVLETWGTCGYSESSERPSAITCVKNS